MSLLACIPRLVAAAALAAACPAPGHAQQFSREQDIVGLRLGQRALVDDGTCPAGQIKEVAGTRLTEAGVAREAKCVPRINKK